MTASFDLPAWEKHCLAFVRDRLSGADPAHDLPHVRRVVANARRLAASEGGELAVIVPAAWLHDCVVVAKNDPRRGEASRLGAAVAANFLAQAGFPQEHLAAVRHAIEAHSYSAGIPPLTLEARVVQDADRLDSLGAIGIARCLLTGAEWGATLYDPDDPFAHDRPLDDRRYSLDHFYVKLLKLAGQMQTAAGQAEAEHRSAVMRRFLNQLRDEIDPPAA